MTAGRGRRGGGRAGGDEPVPLTDSLARVAHELGLADPGTLAVVTGGWDDLVGGALATHARPRSLRAGVLVVEVDGAQWATELRYLEAALLERLASVVGEGVVTGLRVIVGHAGPPA